MNNYRWQVTLSEILRELNPREYANYKLTQVFEVENQNEIFVMLAVVA